MTSLPSPNSSVSPPDNTSTDSSPEVAVYMAYYVIETTLALCAFLGNFSIIFIYALEPKLRQTLSNIYLISLALSDLCMGTIAIPIILVALQGIPRDFPACLALLSLVILIDEASVFALLAMTLDRYYSISQPLHYRVHVTRSRAALGALLGWLMACLFVLPMTLGWHNTPAQPQCYFVEIVSMQYMTFVFFTSISVPFIVMCFVYIRIYGIIRKQLRQMQAVHDIGQRLHVQRSSATQDCPSGVARSIQDTKLDRSSDQHARATQSSPGNIRHMKKEWKTAGFFAFLMLFYFATWMPISIVDVLLYFEVTVRQDVVNGCVFLSHVNSAVNPLLYTLKADFRAAFRQRLFRLCRRRQRTNAVWPLSAGRDSIPHSQRNT